MKKNIMTKINYKSSMMLNYTLSDLQNAASYLNSAVNNSSNLNIPYDFEDIQYLKSLPDTLSNNLRLINKLREWIRVNDNKCNRISNEFINSVNSIDDVTINKRIGYISQK